MGKNALPRKSINYDITDRELIHKSLIDTKTIDYTHNYSPSAYYPSSTKNLAVQKQDSPSMNGLKQL